MNKPFRSYDNKGVMKKHQTLTFAEYRARQYATRVDQETANQIITIRNYTPQKKV